VVRVVSGERVIGESGESGENGEVTSFQIHSTQHSTQWV
jgi:hypothetical protein